LAESGTFAILLRRLRIEAGLTQEDLAAVARVSVRSVSDWERGINKTAHKETVRLLADALRLSGAARTEFEAVARGRSPAEGPAAAMTGVSGASGPTRTLPRDISSFTGREAELSDLMADATVGGVVGIYAIGGMAGVGKTAFAVHAAHRLAHEFPDGQFFLPLHGHTPGQQPVAPADALTSLLLTAGAQATQIPADLEARAAVWRDRLAGKRALLVLDDAADSDQVRLLLPGSPESLVLITSRRRLAALEDATTISLDTLPHEQAAALLARLAARPGLSPDDGAVGEISRLCGYLPLAIGMLARQLHHHPTWAPAELVGELSLARDRLALMTSENLSVAAAFTMSYARLTAEQQRIFRLLGVHPGTDADAYAAAALADLSMGAIRRHLEDLYSHYLLAEPSRGRYRMHDLIREHARSLASAVDPPGDQDAAMGRLLGYFTQAASAAGRLLVDRPNRSAGVFAAGPPGYAREFPAHEQAAAWLESERANMVACVALAAAGPHPEDAVRLVKAISEQLMAAGHWEQAHHAHEHAVAAAKLSPDRADLAWSLSRLGESHKMLDEYDAGASSAGEAVSLYRELDEPQGLADALVIFGDLEQMRRNDADAGIVTLTEAIDIYREIRDPWGEAQALTYLGAIQVGHSEYAIALQTLDRALALGRQIGDRRDQARALNYMSAVHYLSGDYAAATRAVAEAIPLFRSLGSKFGEAHALLNLGATLTASGNYQDAIGAITDALAIYHQLGDRHGQGTSYVYLSEAYIATGRYAEAANALDQASPICFDVANPYGEANVYRFRGEIARRTRDPGADEQLNQALTIYREHGIRLGEGDTLTALGDVQRQAREFTLASATLEEALAIYREIGDRRGQADALNQLGVLAFDMGDIAQARQHYTQALELAREISSVVEEAGALAGLGQCLALHEPDAARAYLTQSLVINQRIGSPRADEVAALLTRI
jgi:tetratricopeptide (TPR) repeat protein/transcriptional regulator with XRE-family HTH domain